MRRVLIAAAVTVSAVVGAQTAGAKSFQPGDVRICGPHACVVLRSQNALDALSRFYYGAPSPGRAPAPPIRSPYLRLEYKDGYVTGVVAGPRFARFLSFGVNLDQFRARTWYVVPPRLAAELRLLAPRLSPATLPGDILSLSH